MGARGVKSVVILFLGLIFLFCTSEMGFAADVQKLIQALELTTSPKPVVLNPGGRSQRVTIKSKSAAFIERINQVTVFHAIQPAEGFVVKLLPPLSSSPPSREIEISAPVGTPVGFFSLVLKADMGKGSFFHAPVTIPLVNTVKTVALEIDEQQEKREISIATQDAHSPNPSESDKGSDLIKGGHSRFLRPRPWLVVLNRTSGGFVEELAYRWAPIHYQDVANCGSHSKGGKSDFIMKINFDGDWNTRNNWEHTGPPYLAYVYYSIVTTKTHWYILYAFYHPRDWQYKISGVLDFDSEHENDMEGALFIVSRDGSLYGKLEAMITVFHHDFYSFKNPHSNYQGRKGQNADIDGPILFENYDGFDHPLTAQQPEGHGLKAYGEKGLNVGSGYNLVGDRLVRDNDWVKYYPSLTVAEAPESIQDRSVKYKLINIFENSEDGLWRQLKNRKVFTKEGNFAGDKSGSCGGGDLDFVKCDENAANPPWKWDDKRFGNYVRFGTRSQRYSATMGKISFWR